jgi:hypothetical protein
MKIKLLTTLATIALASTVQAGPSWGFINNNGSSFYWGTSRPQQTYNYYQVPAYECTPRYYYRPEVHFYVPPQPIYMRPYQQMRPYYQQHHCW